MTLFDPCVTTAGGEVTMKLSLPATGTPTVSSAEVTVLPSEFV
ncbi:MAG: hypothetical protein ABSG06_04315 [Methanoregula sp.]